MLKKEKSQMKVSLNTSNFIHRAEKKHNFFYSYERTIYKQYTTPTIITCPKHGDFTQTPSAHLMGHGCQKCGRERALFAAKISNNKQRLTTEKFIERSNYLHSNKYDYSLVEYVNNKTKVEIICPFHGSFFQVPNKHNSKKSPQGCPKCANKNVTTEEFIQKCKIIHGNKYDYSKVVYKPGYTKIEIICSIHGSFYQVTYNHLSNKQGCPLCKHEKARNNIGLYTHSYFVKYPQEKNKRVYLYMVKIYDDHESFFKVGITKQNPVIKRFYGVPYTIKILHEKEMSLYDAFIEEQHILQDLRKYIPKKKFKGWTECFMKNENISF